MDLKQELMKMLGVPENWDKYDYQIKRYSFEDIQEVLEKIVEELEFKNREKKVEAFKTELKALMKKYNFGKDEIDQYDGMEEYCGTDYYFTIDGETWYSETISEILQDIIEAH